MADYSGAIDTYALNIQSPTVGTNYKRVMYLKGSFGLAFVYFVPSGGRLGTNKKRDSTNDVFDVYFWMDDWDAIVDVLRNEDSTGFYYWGSNNTAQIYTGDEPVGEEET